jgi:hypothetical protein
MREKAIGPKHMGKIT